MLRNYFKIALRNLTKNKTYTFINVFGLAIAFLCSTLLFLNANYELSFDNFHENKNEVFKVYRSYITPEGDIFGSTMPYPAAPTIKAEVSDVKATTRIMWTSGQLEYNNKEFNFDINLVDNDFFNVFTFPIVKGNKKTPLVNAGSAVITERAARKLFKNQEPIGQSIKIKTMGEWKSLVVAAVVKDVPENSSIQFEVLANVEINPDYAINKNNWNNQHHEVYLRLANNAIPMQVEQKLKQMDMKYKTIDETYLKNNGYKPDANGNYAPMKLLPLPEMHYDVNVGTGSNVTSKTYLYTLILIGCFVLAIACFNFINLNIAQSFTRAKEVGVRKCLGAGKKQIFTQIWGETVLICIAGLVLGVGASMLLVPWFNQLFGANLSLATYFKLSTILACLLSVFLVSLIAGGYPALVISKLNTVNVLKGNITLKKPGLFRNSLIVVQFTLACLLMGCTAIAYKQFEYMRMQPLGFNKEAVISIPLHQTKPGRELVNALRMRLQNQPSVVSVSGSSINIGLGKDGNRSKQSNGFGYNDKSILTNWMSVDVDFLKTMGIKVKQGRDFSREFASDKVNAVVVTESMARQFGVKDPVGISFSTDTTRPNWTIVGVVPDFHLYSLHEKVEPITMDVSTDQNIHYAFVKVNSNNAYATMQMIEQVYKEIEPGKEFLGSFMDENTNNWYDKEKKLSLLLGITATVAIVLSCLGLFALALLMIQQRVKEIGVRKVLGASVLSINKLLAIDFVKLVMLSILIATPLSWWVMSKWLQDFPYHITISWVLFLMVGLAAIAIAILTISYHTIRAAMANPVKSLRTE